MMIESACLFGVEVLDELLKGMRGDGRGRDG